MAVSSNTVKLYSPVTGQFVGEYCKGQHSDSSNQILFSENVLHSCSSDETVKAWDTRSYQQVYCLNVGPSQEVFSFSFGGSGDNLFAAGCKSQRLKALLDSKTIESDVSEGDKTKFLSTTSHVSRLDASTSGTLYKHEEEREIFQAAISTPVVNSRVFDEDVASPAEQAKAYMGSRPAKVLPSPLRLGSQPPRQDSAVLNNTTTLLRTPITSPPPRTICSFKGYENRLTTPRYQGRTTWHIHPITEGLQHLAKKIMYEDGDDELKKTISKAWTETRSGKTPDPTKS